MRVSGVSIPVVCGLLWMGVACGPPPELVAERDALKQDVERLTKAEQQLETEVDSTRAKMRALERQLATVNQELALARIGVAADEPLAAELQTSLGTIRCALFPAKAPLTVANFVQLAEGSKAWTDPRTNTETRSPLYDGTIFHRVIPKFMIQGGDPLGSGRGGPGYRFEDETDGGLRFEQPGLLAMANSGPDTNGSQFFITDRSTPHHLDGKHTIFGECQDLDVVEAIASVDAKATRPVKDVVLRRVRILRGEAARR